MRVSGGRPLNYLHPGGTRYLDPRVAGSVYVPFGRSVSLYTTGISDPSGGVTLHLCSSVSAMGALPIDTAGLVGEVRSAVVGTSTDAALVPQFVPLPLQPVPVDTNPLVPIHWFDVSITGSMHREGVLPRTSPLVTPSSYGRTRAGHRPPFQRWQAR